MPVALFTNEQAGPTLEIGISIHSPNQIANTPPLSTVWIKAIADTGATATCISASAAARAALPVIGKGQMQSASHVNAVNLYYGTLWIKCIVVGTWFSWNFPARTFMELGLPGVSNEALLGMDILSQGIFVVNGLERRSSFSW